MIAPYHAIDIALRLAQDKLPQWLAAMNRWVHKMTGVMSYTLAPYVGKDGKVAAIQ